ncbi:MAG: hypothetical protein ABI852_02035 [Gemmatimonadaceae bacterium]
MLRSSLLAVAIRRRHLTLLIPVCVLLLGGCKGIRDKISAKLYQTAAPDDASWKRDSTLIAKNPPILYRVIRKKSDEFVFPIGILGKGVPRTLHLSKRGWQQFDVQMLYQGKEVLPVLNGTVGSPIKMRQGMWEIPSAPLDTVPAQVCPSLIAIGKVDLPTGTNLVVTNYKLPTGMKLLSEEQLEAAVSAVPTLITPGLGITPRVLTGFTRIIRQIPRVGGDPGVYVQYDDFRPVTDTAAAVRKLPRHVAIVLEKGVYGYRPTWIYNTTGAADDRPILRFLAAMDVNGDGQSEIVYGVDVPGGGSFTVVFRQINETWKEFWRRSPQRCDG